MKEKDLTRSDLEGSLVETTTDTEMYHATDCQVSDTTSIQHEYLSGITSDYSL